MSESFGEDGEDSPSVPTCACCGLPVSEGDDDGEPAEYCSTACEEMSASSGLPEYDETMFFDTEVAAIDACLPRGMPRNALTLLSGEAGTRVDTVLVELAWQSLERGEPVVLVAVSDPPLTLLHQFLTLDWNVLPHLEDGRLRIIDAYTYRNSRDRDVVCDAWDAHILDIAENAEAIARVHDPTQPEQIRRKLRLATQDLSMDCRGTFIIDSLTELGTLLQPSRAYELLKNLRADYCKARKVTTFCGANYTGNHEEFPHEMEYLFDGIFDLSLDPNTIPGLLLKRFTVRKMRGVMSVRESNAYEFAANEGMVLINPTPESEDGQEGEPTPPPQEGGHSGGPTQPSARASNPEGQTPPPRQSGVEAEHSQNQNSRR